MEDRCLSHLNHLREQNQQETIHQWSPVPSLASLAALMIDLSFSVSTTMHELIKSLLKVT
jgi:hypothetical protein